MNNTSPIQLIAPTKAAYDDKHLHRYTDTCLFYPSALSNRKRRRDGYMRRYSTSSIGSQSTVTSMHRKAMSLGALQLVAMDISNKLASDWQTGATTTSVDTSPITDGTTVATETLESNNRNSDLHNAMEARQSLSARKTEPSSTEQPPHEMIAMGRAPTKAVRLERDYSRGDGVTRFCTDFPPELSGRIDPNQLCHTVEKINDLLANAEKISSNVFDNIMECLTLYIWPIFFSTHYLRSIKHLAQFIDSQNEQLYHPQGVSIANPVRSAFLFIEVRLYD